VTIRMYPGTRGSTQGDAKETTPAANASIGAHHAPPLIARVTSATTSRPFRLALLERRPSSQEDARFAAGGPASAFAGSTGKLAG